MALPASQEAVREVERSLEPPASGQLKEEMKKARITSAGEVEWAVRPQNFGRLADEISKGLGPLKTSFWKRQHREVWLSGGRTCSPEWLYIFRGFFPKQFTVRGSQFFLKMCPPFVSLLV